MSQSTFLNNMDFFSLALELFRNADHFIFYIAENYGWWVYFVLFSIFFSETGLVIAAFLPGDSLLFISGAAAAAGALEVSMLILLITLGAILGNTLNYYIGSWLGLISPPYRELMTFMKSTVEKPLFWPVSFRSFALLHP